METEGGDPKQVVVFGGLRALAANLGLEVKEWEETKRFINRNLI